MQSFRSRLRAFQKMHGGEPSRGFVADLEFLENRDLDLSVRLGAMLAFNALLITIGTHPLSSSTGAPLNLDVATQPFATIAVCIGIAPFVWSSWLCLRALLVGEEFAVNGGEDEHTVRRRLLAAFVHSIDMQSRYLGASVRVSLAGGGLTVFVWIWILGAKMIG